ncbi:MAG: DUF885 domain-containing protein [Myxococcaceae bacterium]|nr:DUF885 domain-containing protein [Myxococcaceae bacterium]
MRASLLCLLVLGAAGGCAHTASRSAPLDAHARMELLSEAYWDFLMEDNPVWATSLGDRRFDEQLPDVTPEARQRRLGRLHAFKAEASALADAALTGEERITRDALLSQLSGALVDEVCRPELWAVNPLDGVQTMLGELAQLHTISTRAHADALVARYTKAGVLLDAHVENLRSGLGGGRSAARVAVERVIGQLERMLATPPEASPFVTRVALPAGWSGEEAREVREALTRAVRRYVYPGLTRYLAFLRRVYLPRARTRPGLSANRGGRACYEARLRVLVGARTPEDIHQVGLLEVEKALAGMRALARARLGTEDVEALEELLRRDSTQSLATRELLLAHAESLVARAREAMPRAFHRLPGLTLEVKPVDTFREADSPAGYYHQGSGDSSRPATFFVNLREPEQRSLFLLEPLTFHEALPGHHLQAALGQELRGLPRFRRELGDTTFVEGWAHYAELLADELGLYSGDAARFGMYSDQALRAARLVTDTGLHALGWSREKAVRYLEAHTAESRAECEREVDRYIVWPAQALSYKLGQLEFLALRREAQGALGERFELGAFHAAVHAHGAVPMPVLRRLLAEWVERQKQGRE